MLFTVIVLMFYNGEGVVHVQLSWLRVCLRRALCMCCMNSSSITPLTFSSMCGCIALACPPVTCLPALDPPRACLPVCLRGLLVILQETTSVCSATNYLLTSASRCCSETRTLKISFSEDGPG